MDDYRIKPFTKIIPKMSTYVKSYDGETKSIYFLIEGDELLKNTVIIGRKLAIVLKKEFGSEHNYNKKILKTRIKSYDDETTDYHDSEILLIDFLLKNMKTIIHKCSKKM